MPSQESLVSSIPLTPGDGLGPHHIAFGVAMILRGLSEEYGLNLEDPNFAETPNRVEKAYRELFGGLKDTDRQINEILKSTFPCESTAMVIQRNIRVFSMCPHHLLPVSYRVHVAYVPDKGGNVLGLSKLSRLVEILARRPVLQEKFTNDITMYLMSLKGCIGAACTVHGQHYCMMMRGAEQPDAISTTSSLKGVLMDEDEARHEFLALTRE